MRSIGTRLGAVFAALLLGAVLLASPAGAQACGGYGQPVCDTTTTSSTTPTTPTTTPTTPTTEAPPPATTTGTTSNPTPAPGESVPIAVPVQPAAIRIDPTKPASAILVNAGGDSNVAAPTPTITQNADGSISISIVVPPSTPPGVYLIAVVAQDSLGRPRVVIVPVVVRRTTASAAAAGGERFSSAASVEAASVGIPAAALAQVNELAASVEDLGGEEAVASAVLDDGAELSVEGDALGLLPRTGSDTSRPLVAALAVTLAGAGLLLLQRRLPVISKRSR